LPNLGSGFPAYRYGDGSGGNPGTLTLTDQGGAGWTLSPSAGIAANGSAFNVIGAQGNQAGLLQFQSSISQAIAGFKAQSYVVSFLAEGRDTSSGGAGANDVEVLLDNAPLTFGGATSITPGMGGFTAFTSDPFTVTAGTHTLTFTGLDTLGGDRTSFIDSVHIGATSGGHSSAVALAAPSSAGAAAAAVIGTPPSGGTGVLPAAPPAVLLSGSASGDAGLSLPLSLALSGRQQALGNDPPLALAGASAASPSAANQAVLDRLFSGGLGADNRLLRRQQKGPTAALTENTTGLLE
jgi:hypothetical protein